MVRYKNKHIITGSTNHLGNFGNQNIVVPFGICYNNNTIAVTGNTSLVGFNNNYEQIFVTTPTAIFDDINGIVYNPYGKKIVADNSGTPATYLTVGYYSGNIYATYGDNTELNIVFSNTNGYRFNYLTIGILHNKVYLYVTEYYKTNTVFVFDCSTVPYKIVSGYPLVPNAFKDQAPPNYILSNIANIYGALYVLYWPADIDTNTNTNKKGYGAINIYATNGKLIKKLIPENTNKWLSFPNSIIPEIDACGNPTKNVIVSNSNCNINVFNENGKYVRTISVCNEPFNTHKNILLANGTKDNIFYSDFVDLNGTSNAFINILTPCC